MICQHGQLQRQCMLCFFEGENIELTQEIEQLRADNAALLEGLNEIMDKEMMRYQCDTPAYTIARECIAKLGGRNDD